MTEESTNELDVVEKLTAIEAIKQLKARYFRLIDTKDWVAFRDVFTDDCRHYYVPTDGPETFSTNDDYFPMMEATLAKGVTTHHGHPPEITVTSPTEAEAIWAMFDYVQVDAPHGRTSLMGYGHYFETYRKGDDGQWRMSSKRNLRLRVDDVPWTLPTSDPQPAVTDSELHYATLWEEIADTVPESPALQHGPDSWTWAEFDDRSARLAGGLRAHGLDAGDGVGAYLYNCSEYFELFFGALKMRAVPSNVNYRYGRDELLALLENSEAKALFFDTSLADRVEAVADRARHVRLLVEVGSDEPSFSGAVTYRSLIESSAPLPRMKRAGTDVFLSYTGGTTGLPKGVLFDIGESTENSVFIRNQFLALTDAPGPLEFAVQQAERGEPMRAIPASPLMHSTGFFFASLPTLTAGGTVTTLLERSFDAHELLRTVEATETQVVAIVGDAFALPIVRALDEGRPDATPYKVSSLRVFCSAGVAWSAHVKERIFQHLPDVMLFDSCGSTEGVFFGMRQIRRGDSLSTANFDAAPGLKVLSPEREELPQGEIGMLASTTTATGYHRDPEKTATTYFYIDGVRYATPGDLGRIEADGTVTLIGRGVTTINTGGEKVYPAEVEDAIKDVAGVEDCLVIGVPDERFGQKVAALVVADRALVAESSSVTDAVRASLAGYKIPRHIRFVDAVPRLPNGKVDYPTAAELAADEVTRGST